MEEDLLNTERLYTMRQTCKILGVHPNTLRKWDEKGVLKAVRIGLRKDRRWKESAIIDIIYEGHIQQAILRKDLEERDRLWKEHEKVRALFRDHLRKNYAA